MNYIRDGSLQFSGAQVAAMLLNIGHEGTHYTSCSFGGINIYVFKNYVEKMRGDFRVVLGHKDLTERDDEGYETSNDSDEEGQEEGLEGSDSTGDADIGDEVTIGDNVSGRQPEHEGQGDQENITVPDVVQDYIFRGEELNDRSIYEMEMETKCVTMTEEERERYEYSIEQGVHAGRPFLERVRFQIQHSRASSRWIMLRSKQVVPCIFGTIMCQINEC
jgi:hypothetical protein